MRDDIARALMALERRGRLTRAAVVEAARDPASPLHDRFPWDDQEAAEAYRLAIAGDLIREVKVVVTIETIDVKVAAYVSDPERQSGYVRLSRIKPGSDQARGIVLEEMARVRGALERSRRLALVLGLSDELERLINEAARFRERAEEVA